MVNMPAPRSTSCSLKQIAQEAGVSVDTVSRVLNGKIKGLRRDAVTRAKTITELARRYNYRPHASARALQAQRFFALGYFNTAIWTEPYHGQILVEPGIYSTAASLGYSVIYMQGMAERPDEQVPIPKSMRELSMDALVVSYGTAISHAWQEVLDHLPIPVVHLNRKHPFNAVYHDEIEASYRLTRFFLDRRFTRIDFLSPNHNPAHPHYSDADRLAGYRQAMDEAKRPVHARTLYTDNCRVTDESFAQLADWLTDPATRPQVVICQEDSTLFFRFQQVLVRLGLTIPRDLLVGSFGYGLFAPNSPMPMVTMAIPYLPISQAAVEMAIDLTQSQDKKLASKTFRSQMVIFPELVGLLGH